MIGVANRVQSYKRITISNFRAVDLTTHDEVVDGGGGLVVGRVAEYRSYLTMMWGGVGGQRPTVVTFSVATRVKRVRKSRYVREYIMVSARLPARLRVKCECLLPVMPAYVARRRRTAREQSKNK